MYARTAVSYVALASSTAASRRRAHGARCATKIKNNTCYCSPKGKKKVSVRCWPVTLMRRWNALTWTAAAEGKLGVISIKSELQIGTNFKGVSKLSKYFYCLAALVSFISKFQEFSTTYYCWSLHRFQTYLNYHFYEELGMNNLHILFSGDEITYVPNILFSDVYNIYIHSGLKYRTHSFILQIFWKKTFTP